MSNATTTLTACTDCNVEVEHRTCVDCGREADVVDCGHHAQPTEIAASAHDGAPVSSSIGTGAPTTESWAYLDIWPAGRFRKARKPFKCMYGPPRCAYVVQPGERYFDSGDSTPEVAGGFGSERYCLGHGEARS